MGLAWFGKMFVRQIAHSTKCCESQPGWLFDDFFSVVYDLVLLPVEIKLKPQDQIKFPAKSWSRRRVFCARLNVSFGRGHIGSQPQSYEAFTSLYLQRCYLYSQVLVKAFVKLEQIRWKIDCIFMKLFFHWFYMSNLYLLVKSKH